MSLGPGNRHSHQILGFFRGCFGLFGMDPRTLISNVSHFKEVFVEPRVLDGFLEQVVMGSGVCRRPPPRG